MGHPEFVVIGAKSKCGFFNSHPSDEELSLGTPVRFARSG
jgi:hypothetical protein